MNTRQRLPGDIKEAGDANRLSTSKKLLQTVGSVEATACTRSIYLLVIR